MAVQEDKPGTPLFNYYRSLWNGLCNCLTAICLKSTVQLLLATCFAFCLRFWRGFYTFCQQSEIIGIRYLVGANERVLWALLLAVAAFGSLYCVLEFVANYEKNLFQFIIEDQPQFELLNFPSVAVCEMGTNVELRKLQSVMMSFNMVSQVVGSDDKFQALMNALTFEDYHREHNETFTEIYNFSLESGNLENFDKIDFKEVANQLRSKCNELFGHCTWHNKGFNCCQYFLPLQSLMQSCYVLNSLQTEVGSKFLDMKIGKYTANRELELVFNRPVKTFLLTADEVPQLATSVVRTPTLQPGHHAILDFKLSLSLNDPGIYEFGPKVTECLPPNYPPDKISGTYKYVSYTSCLSDCLRLLQFKICGCIKHTLNEGVEMAKRPYCKLSGYVCLERNKIYSFYSMSNLKKSTCNQCLQTCERNSIITSDLTWLVYEKPGIQKQAKVTIKMNGFPKKRTRRMVVRHKIDFAVLLGGIFSIFIGISLVNIIELLHCILSAFLQPKMLN